MKSLRLAACLALATACAAPALAAKWEKIADVGAAAAYLDKDSVKRSGNQVRATIEWRWANPVPPGDAGMTRSYVMERQLQIANCDNRAWAVAEGIRYADVQGTDPVDNYKNEEAFLPWSIAPAKTIRDNVVRYVCSLPPKKS